MRVCRIYSVKLTKMSRIYKCLNSIFVFCFLELTVVKMQTKEISIK